MRRFYGVVRRIKKGIASVLAASLVLGVPGGEAWNAAAQVHRAPAAASGAAGLGQAGAGVAAIGPISASLSDARAPFALGLGETAFSAALTTIGIEARSLGSASASPLETRVATRTPGLTASAAAPLRSLGLAPPAAAAPHGETRPAQGGRPHSSPAAALRGIEAMAPRTSDAPSSALELLEHPERVALSPARLASIPDSDLRSVAQALIEPVLGLRSAGPPAADASRLAAGVPYGLVGMRRSVKPVDPGDTPHESARAPLPVPPSADAAPASTASRLLGAAASPLRILEDSDRNREYWKFVGGQALLALGVAFHSTALPSFVTPSKGDSGRTGMSRSVDFGSQAIASFGTGPMIDRSPLRRMLVLPTLARSVILMMVPVLFFNMSTIGGILPLLSFFVAFQIMMFAQGFFSAMTQNASNVALNRILAEDMDNYNRAYAVYHTITYLVGVVGPILAGIFITWATAATGIALAGNALAFGVTGALVAAVAALYGAYLHIPRDQLVEAQRALAKELASGPARDKRIRGVRSIQIRGVPRLLVEVDGPRAAVGVPAEFQGYRVRKVPRRSRFGELLRGIRLLRKDRFMKLTILFSALELIAGDALEFVALPRLIEDVLGLGGSALPGAASIPLLGGILGGMPGSNLAFGLMLAAQSLGLGLSSLPFMFKHERSSQELEARLYAFRGRLAKAEPLGEALVDVGVEAVHDAVYDQLDEYREALGKDPSFERGADEFQRAILTRTRDEFNKYVFFGRRPQADIERLFRETGLEEGLQRWSEAHYATVMREVRTEARTRLNRMERQARFTSILYGVGALAMWGVFFSGNVWISVAWMFAASVLQGAATIVWPSLVTRLMQERHRNDQGKMYSAQAMFNAICAIIGVLALSGMMVLMATHTVLIIMAAVMTGVAVLHFIEPFVVLPVDRGKLKK
ncbi:MAG: MFS transporter [Elusimicrobia bacterium]|nr:MFS transporter [Elusimicrobiota bacterium]